MTNLLVFSLIGLTLFTMLGIIARYRHSLKMAKLDRTASGGTQQSYSANGKIK